MYNKKVEITGINTNQLKTLSNDQMIELFKEYKQGNQKAKDILYGADRNL